MTGISSQPDLNGHVGLLNPANLVICAAQSFIEGAVEMFNINGNAFNNHSMSCFIVIRTDFGLSCSGYNTVDKWHVT